MICHQVFRIPVLNIKFMTYALFIFKIRFSNWKFAISVQSNTYVLRRCEIDRCFMMLLDNIVYTVKEISHLLGWQVAKFVRLQNVFKGCVDCRQFMYFPGIVTIFPRLWNNFYNRLHLNQQFSSFFPSCSDT